MILAYNSSSQHLFYLESTERPSKSTEIFISTYILQSEKRIRLESNQIISVGCDTEKHENPKTIKKIFKPDKIYSQ